VLLNKGAHKTLVTQCCVPPQAILLWNCK